MRLTLYILVGVFFINLYGQTKLLVFDGVATDAPLKNVKIIDDNENLLGITNALGEFFVNNNHKTVSLSLEGYIPQKIRIYGNELNVYLEPNVIELNESIVGRDDAEARELIKAVIQNVKKNSLENLESYQYKSYSKFLVTVNKDSMTYFTNPISKKDSSYMSIRKMLEESHLMFGERAMDHFFSKKYGKKNIVKASRIAGTQAPLYEFVAMQPISHYFNDNKIDFFFRKISNPISNEGLQAYRFRLLEDSNIQGVPTKVISFYPKKSAKKPQIKGKIWIDDKNKALAKFYGESTNKNQISELNVEWIPYKGYWFPSHQHYLMSIGSMSYPATKDSILADDTIQVDTIRKKEKVWINLTTNFKEIESPKQFNPKIFKGYEDEIAPQAFEKWDEILPNYRDSTLSAMEKNTYVKIDSLAQEHKMDRNLKLLRILSSGGKLSIGKIDYDLTKIFNYNDYEGIRLGVGARTNHKFNENFSLNGFLAYGFRDEKIKYGAGVDAYVNKPYSGRIFINYTQDVLAAGRTPMLLQSNYIKFLYGNFNNIYNNNFYSYKKATTGYEQDIFKNLTFNFSINYTEQQSQFLYTYQNKSLNENYLLVDTSLAIRYAPKEKNIRTPYGKVTMKSDLPVYYLTVTKNWNVFNADYIPTTIDFTYYDKYRTFLGRSNIVLKTGITLGNTPIFNLFEGMGNAKKGNTILGRFGVSGFNHFETMLPGEFFTDRYASLQIKHTFAGIKIFKKEIYPEFVYRSLIGGMKNVQNHKQFNFSVPKKYYQEAGVEFNQLLFGMLGLGVYYRLGNYSLGNFNDNLFLKATARFSFF